MDNSSSRINSLSAPAMLVLTSTAEATRGTNTPCQQARHFGVSMSMDKSNQMPYLSPAYSLMYHHPDRLGAPAASREYPPHLLSLHRQFGHPSLDCGSVGMLGYGALHPFPPFHLSEDMECFQAGYLSSKRAKMLSGSDPPQVRYLGLDKGLEAQRNPMSREMANGIETLSPGSSKYRRSPPCTQAMSKHERKLEACQPLFCPLCKRALQRAELIDHLQYEIGTLTSHLSDSDPETPHEEETSSTQSQAVGSASHEGSDSPRRSPLVSEEGPKVDRQQSFQQVKSNREARLGARAGRCKRMKGVMEEQLLRAPRLLEVEDELSEGSRWGDEDSPVSRKGGLEPKESRVLTPMSISSTEGEVDMESDGEEHALYPSHKSSSPCSSSPAVREEDTPAGLRLGTTEKGEGEDLALAAKTMHRMKAQIQELTQRLLRADFYKCHICLDSYSVPLASIQCWHIHCEQCWLRTLGTKKLCPQCHTITSPADLRRVYL
ncbi:E3 ubiquitin-protein ligase Rnf220-like isoform X2 [Ambystoma mexicanum]|uniref:E3 ubiquitin-protein ligase Rnf220-like isoform X2 n=1 Tax=Ambystoma mexicanum TaxID=8296 RepID=UPI0037E7563C